MKDYKSYNNHSFSNLHYSYFNPIKSIYSNPNKYKRKRLKDSYVDLALEKRDFISFEINQKELEKINSQLTIFKQITHSKSGNNSNFLNTNKINSNSDFNSKNMKNKRFKIKLEKPYSTTLRSQSYIINNKEFENLFDNNKSKKINQRKINCIQSYKINKKNKSKFDERDSDLSSTTRKIDNTNLVKIKSEEFKNNEDNLNEKLTNNIEITKINKIKIYNSSNNQCDKKNIDNNIFKYNNSFKSSNNRCRKINYEDDKNNEYEPKNKTIYDSIRKINDLLENNSNKIKPKKYNYKKSNLKKRLLKKSSSCPSINTKIKNKENKKQSSEIFKIDGNDELKENIKNILKKDRIIFDEKKILNKNKYQNDTYSIYIKEDEYNERKLKNLLAKIPNHNGKKELKKYPDYMIMFQNKKVNLVNKYKNIKKTKNIMPPNNLEDLLLKNKLKFFYKIE